MMDKEKRKNELFRLYYERDKEFEKAKLKRTIWVLLGFAALYLFLIWRLIGISKGLGAVGDIVVAIVLAGIHFAINGAVFWIISKKSWEENAILERLRKEITEIDQRLLDMKSRQNLTISEELKKSEDEKRIKELWGNYCKKDKQSERAKLWRMIPAILFFSLIYFAVVCHFFGIPQAPFDFSGTPKEILNVAIMIFIFFVIGSIHFWINLCIFAWFFHKWKEEKEILKHIKDDIYRNS